MEVINASFTTRKSRVWLYGADDDYTLCADIVGQRSASTPFSSVADALEAFGSLVKRLAYPPEAKAARNLAKAAVIPGTDEVPALMPVAPKPPAAAVSPSKNGAELVDILTRLGIAWPGGRYNAAIDRLGRKKPGEKIAKVIIWTLKPKDGAESAPSYGSMHTISDVIAAGSVVVEKSESGMIDFEFKIL